MSQTPGFPRAAACLRERADVILEAWEREVRRRRGYAAAEPPSPMLRNDIPAMIPILANALGPPAVEPVSDRAPYDHALQRFAEDLPLEALVEEYGVLRNELFRALAEGARDELPDAWPLVAGHIDRAIGEAVARYSEQRTRWLLERDRERERARAEWQLVAATLGHDVKSPISTIRLAAQRLEQLDASEQVHKLSGGIVRSSRRLSDLVGTLLDLAQSWERPLELSRQQVDLSALVRELIADKGAAWESPRVRVETRDPVVGHWDRQRLVRIVENLVDNARLHGEPGADIDVSVTREEAYARLSVTNRGQPIAPEDGERLFEPYTRGGATPAAGSGLGLYIVKRLAEAHGGYVVLATGEQTTTFRVLLPMAGAEASFDTPRGAS